MYGVLRYGLVLILGFGAGYEIGHHTGTVVHAEKEGGETVRKVDLSLVDGGIYKVRKVVDGDTIVLENGMHVRYNGVNAPETGHFVKDAAPMAIEATQRNIALVEDKRIRLRIAKDPLDLYGRIVAHVMILPEENKEFTQETDAGLVLVREGLARPMGLGVTHDELAAIKKLDDEAKAAKVGLWSLEDKVRASSAGKPYCATSYPNGHDGVFHIATCAQAQRIKATNRHEYATIEEAEAAGLRPCKCVPK